MNHEIINEEELLVGDIVQVCPGETISFDCLMVQGGQLKVNESYYRGETTAFIKRRYPQCLAIYQEMMSEGTLTEHNSERVPSPVILAGTTIYEGTASVLVTGLGENSSTYKYESNQRCHIESSLESKWKAFCMFTKKFVKMTQGICILIFLINLYHILQEYSYLDSDDYWFRKFELLEVTLCMSVACLPTGYLKMKHDSWSRYCWELSEKYKCTFKKFSTFNKLAAINKILIPMEELFYKDLSQFQVVSLSGSHYLPYKSKAAPNRILRYIKGPRAKELIENLATVIYCACDRKCPLRIFETFLHLKVFSTFKKTDLKIMTRLKFLEDQSYFGKDFQSSKVIARDFQVKKEYGFTFLKFCFSLDKFKYIHDMETDEVIKLTEDKRSELETQMNEKFKNKGQFPLILSYKELGPICSEENKYSFQDFEDGMTLICIVFVEFKLSKDQIEEFQLLKQYKIEPVFGSYQTQAADSLICKQLGISEITHKNIDKYSIRGDELQLKTGDVDLNFAQKDKKYRLSNQEEFNLIEKNLKFLKNPTPEDIFRAIIGFRDSGKNLALLFRVKELSIAMLNNYYNIALEGCPENGQMYSDLVLDHNSFGSIINCIKRSRIQQNKIRMVATLEITWIVTLLSTSLVSSIFKKQSMLSGVQIIWVSNLYSINEGTNLAFRGSLSYNFWVLLPSYKLTHTEKFRKIISITRISMIFRISSPFR